MNCGVVQIAEYIFRTRVLFTSMKRTVCIFERDMMHVTDIKHFKFGTYP